MALSFGPDNKLSLGRPVELFVPRTNPSVLSLAQNGTANFLTSKAPARLVDLRSPETFRNGFIPGSYNVSDLACWLAAQKNGLFNGREIYFLADALEQVELFAESELQADEAEIVGWFGPEALQEWRRSKPLEGQIEAISSDTLAIRLAGWNTLVLNLFDQVGGRLRYPAELHFPLNDLPAALEGLPTETSICIAADSDGLASYSASLLWNFGFHKMSYVVTEL